MRHLTSNPPELPAGFAYRGLTTSDVGAATALVRSDQEEVTGSAYLDEADLLGMWGRPSFDLTTDAIGVVDRDGRLVAAAELTRPERSAVVVGSSVRGRGIGSVLLAWVERRAAAVGAEFVGQTVPVQHSAAIQLLRGRGYELRWTSWMLSLPEQVQIDDAVLPTGWTIRQYEPGRDEQAVYRTVEDAFNEWPDRPPVAYEDWAAMILGRPGFAPWQLLLVETDDGAVVGVASLAVTANGQGWIEQLAVSRACRGRGLGRALLAAGFAATRTHGARTAVLTTDSRTGALDLYLHVGMVVTAEFVHLTRTLATDDGGVGRR